VQKELSMLLYGSNLTVTLLLFLGQSLLAALVVLLLVVQFRRVRLELRQAPPHTYPPHIVRQALLLNLYAVLFYGMIFFNPLNGPLPTGWTLVLGAAALVSFMSAVTAVWIWRTVDAH
jgi:hypothetical protein